MEHARWQLPIHSKVQTQTGVTPQSLKLTATININPLFVRALLQFTRKYAFFMTLNPLFYVGTTGSRKELISL